MLKIEALREELVQIASVTEEHEEVARKSQISTSYLRQIRQGKNAKLDTQANRELVKQLINIYRRIAIRKGLILENVLKKVSQK